MKIYIDKYIYSFHGTEPATDECEGSEGLRLGVGCRVDADDIHDRQGVTTLSNAKFAGKFAEPLSVDLLSGFDIKAVNKRSGRKIYIYIRVNWKVI